MSGPAAIVVPAVRRHTSTVIVAHGLGDSGAGWSFLSEQWRQKNKFPETKFIFPNAPTIPITINMGMKMPGWYDIVSFDALQESEDGPGIKRSQDYFHGLIAKEIEAGIPSERIVLGGFSQGGAMSLISGVTSPVKLGGIFGLSSYLLLKGKIRDMVPKDNPNKVSIVDTLVGKYVTVTDGVKDTPIFMGHGDMDAVVRYEWGQQTAAKLKEWGWTVDFNTYRGLPHSAAPEEINDLEKYLKARIPDQGDKGAL